MEVYYKTRKLQKICNSEKEILREWGPSVGRALMRRLAQLEAAANLEEIGHLPPARLHELKGDREGQFATDITTNYRLIIIPANSPVPVKKDGGVDKKRVTKVCVIEVVDYHGE